MSNQLDELLKNYKPWNEEEDALVKQLKQFLAMTENAYDRSNAVGHVVANAWIVNAARSKVVLVEYVNENIWLAPGGHCDGSPDVRAAALREAEEETGLLTLKPLLNGNVFDVTAGWIPTRKKVDGLETAHVHVCFAFEADERESLVVSEESSNIAWVELKNIDKINYFERQKHLVLKILAGVLA